MTPIPVYERRELHMVRNTMSCMGDLHPLKNLAHETNYFPRGIAAEKRLEAACEARALCYDALKRLYVVRMESYRSPPMPLYPMY